MRIAPAQNLIVRENDSRRIDSTPTSREKTSRRSWTKSKIVSRRSSFPRYHAEVLGEYAGRQAAQAACYGCRWPASLGVVSSSAGVPSAALRVAVLGFLTLPLCTDRRPVAAYFTGDVISLGSLRAF